ncbi:MAG: lipopolysaccharide biosynthesis protein, partial [Phormidesmis sp. CAN_BIN44]|nr:lipopolysaccharide biosynthesis protein [Phormidesmis sp. CAN_BIN44]
MHTIQPLTLRHNFSWTFLGNVVYAGCQWAMLVVLAKLGTPEMVGQFTLGLAVTAPMMLLCNLQLRAIQATDTQRQYQFSDYFSLRLVTTTLALVMIVGVVLLGGYRGDTAWIILTIGIAKAIESISDVFYGFLQQQERMDRIA